MRLNGLSDNPGSSKKRMRVGRGIGSGKGKTGGRGVKGQKARTGVAIKGFEGGQMPLHRRLPKRGFHNLFANDFNEVNVGRLQQAVDAGKLDASVLVTVEALVNAGICSNARDGVKILGAGELSTKLNFEVVGASKSAVEAIEKLGGKVTIIETKADKAKATALAEKAATARVKA
jgi:large subunit ribosomal protein L15